MKKKILHFKYNKKPRGTSLLPWGKYNKTKTMAIIIYEFGITNADCTPYTWSR